MMRKRVVAGLWAGLALLVVLGGPAAAAEIRCMAVWGKLPDGETIDAAPGDMPCFNGWLGGEIVPGDGEKVELFLKQNRHLSNLQLASPGGSVREAMRIARALRSSLMATWTFRAEEKSNWKDACDSACTIAALGGVRRSLGYIGLRRPVTRRAPDSSFDSAKQDFATITAELEEFFREFGLPRAMLDRMLVTGPESLDRIGSAEVRRYVPTFDAAFQEWVHGRCRTNPQYAVCLNDERQKEIFRRAKLPQ